MLDQKNRTRVWLGVVIVNKDKQILVGKRKGGHEPYFSIPGGNLEVGESFEEAAVREIKEETSLDIKNPKVIAVTNNLETYHKEGLHYISIILLVQEFSGDIKIMEPEKCEQWLWSDPNNLPTPHFSASAMGVNCYLNNIFYKAK